MLATVSGHELPWNCLPCTVVVPSVKMGRGDQDRRFGLSVRSGCSGGRKEICSLPPPSGGARPVLLLSPSYPVVVERPLRLPRCRMSRSAPPLCAAVVTCCAACFIAASKNQGVAVTDGRPVEPGAPVTGRRADITKHQRRPKEARCMGNSYRRMTLRRLAWEKNPRVTGGGASQKIAALRHRSPDQGGPGAHNGRTKCRCSRGCPESATPRRGRTRRDAWSRGRQQHQLQKARQNSGRAAVPAHP